MSLTHRAAFIPSAGSPLEIRTIPTASPGPNDLLVKNSAIGINPLDWKQRKLGIFVNFYPKLIGSDISGTVTAIGSSIKNFKVGDRITAFAPMFFTDSNANGAFQEYTLVDYTYAAIIPDSISFLDAATLPMAVATSGTALFTRLGLDRIIPSPQDTKKKDKAILIWGAASTVGAMAVQIASRLGLLVIATASSANHKYVKSLGADFVFDYRSTTVKQDIISAAANATTPLKIGLDAISLSETTKLFSEILLESGGVGSQMVYTLNPVKGSEPVEGIKTHAVLMGSDGEEYWRDFRTWLFNKFLAGGLKEGSMSANHGTVVVEGGLEGLQEALGIMKRGVSRVKVVVSLE